MINFLKHIIVFTFVSVSSDPVESGTGSSSGAAALPDNPLPNPSTSSSGSFVKIPPTSKVLKPNPTSNIDKFIVKTSSAEKVVLDKSVASMVYATNSPFALVEHNKFRNMCKSLRPGYQPPSAYQVGNKLLNPIYEEEKEKCLKKLEGKVVCAALDGWSNVKNDPIICVTVTNSGDVNLVDTIDTSGSSHTAEYLCETATHAINKIEKEYKCTVGSLVTDNAANVAKMRNELSKIDNRLITYGCSSHILNLLAHDLEIKNVKAQVVAIVKYFRNNHFAHSTYKSMGGNELVLPQDVRWNTMADCLKLFLDNWSKLLQIREGNRDKID